MGRHPTISGSTARMSTQSQKSCAAARVTASSYRPTQSMSQAKAISSTMCPMSYPWRGHKSDPMVNTGGAYGVARFSASLHRRLAYEWLQALQRWHRRGLPSLGPYRSSSIPYREVAELLSQSCQQEVFH